MSDIDPMEYARQLDAHYDHGAPPPPGQPPAATRHPYDLIDPGNNVEPPIPPKPPQHSIAQQDGEDLQQWEDRLRGEHEARQRYEAERPANEELLRRALGNAYQPLPNTDTAPADAPRTRRDGSSLTAYDLKLAAEMQRLHPYMDLGARIPPGYRR